MSAEPGRVETLDEALRRFRGWLAGLDGFPGWREERLIEIGRGTRYVRVGDGPFAWHVTKSAISTPATYADRFEELLGLGYGWVNVSCYGTLDGIAIVAVELPGHPTGVPRGMTSVNFSGPPRDIKTGCPRWNAEAHVLVVPE